MSSESLMPADFNPVYRTSSGRRGALRSQQRFHDADSMRTRRRPRDESDEELPSSNTMRRRISEELLSHDSGDITSRDDLLHTVSQLTEAVQSLIGQQREMLEKLENFLPQQQCPQIQQLQCPPQQPETFQKVADSTIRTYMVDHVDRYPTRADADAVRELLPRTLRPSTFVISQRIRDIYRNNLFKGIKRFVPSPTKSFEDYICLYMRWTEFRWDAPVTAYIAALRECVHYYDKAAPERYPKVAAVNGFVDEKRGAQFLFAHAIVNMIQRKEKDEAEAWVKRMLSYANDPERAAKCPNTPFGFRAKSLALDVLADRVNDEDDMLDCDEME